jgi:hypothetical protein
MRRQTVHRTKKRKDGRYEQMLRRHLEVCRFIQEIAAYFLNELAIDP